MSIQAFLTRHALVLQAGGALVTAVAAVLALIVVPWQIGAADRLQQAQSARDIYRDFLNLTVQKPEVASTDLCQVGDAAARVAYEAYVDHLLYTAEQVMDVSEDWTAPMQAQLDRHRPFLCSWEASDLEAFSTPVAGLLKGTLGNCSGVKVCP
jgi:hypothetical protein